MGIKRVSFIDCMRGFSLIGILLANLLIFQFGMYGKDTLEGLNWLNQGVLYFTRIFIEGSFMPIFTLLFGFSLIKLVESVRHKGRKSRWVIVRRSIGLIVLGWLHSTLLWEGDILLSYGVMLLLLLPFIHRKAKIIFIWAGIFFVLSMGLSYGSMALSAKEQGEMDRYIAKADEVYAHGSYRAIMDFRLNEIPPGFEDAFFFYILILLAPIFFAALFLIGMGLAKLQAFEEMERERKWYRIGGLLVPVGLLCKSFSFLESDVSTMLLLGGSQLLSLGYVCLAALLYQKWQFSAIPRAFECVGKLSLSNYLLQTIICTTVFYGYGLGLYGQLGVFMGMLLGFVVFGMQCIVSTAYLKKWQRGPFEQLLRMWTNWSLSGRLKPKE